MNCKAPRGTEVFHGKICITDVSFFLVTSADREVKVKQVYMHRFCHKVPCSSFHHHSDELMVE